MKSVKQNFVEPKKISNNDFINLNEIRSSDRVNVAPVSKWSFEGTAGAFIRKKGKVVPAQGEVLNQNSMLSPTIPSDRDTKLNDYNTRSLESSGLNRANTGHGKAMVFDDLENAGRDHSHHGDES